MAGRETNLKEMKMKTQFSLAGSLWGLVPGGLLPVNTVRFEESFLCNTIPSSQGGVSTLQLNSEYMSFLPR